MHFEKNLTGDELTIHDSILPNFFYHFSFVFTTLNFAKESKTRNSSMTLEKFIVNLIEIYN